MWFISEDTNGQMAILSPTPTPFLGRSVQDREALERHVLLASKKQLLEMALRQARSLEMDVQALEGSGKQIDLSTVGFLQIIRK